MSLTTPIVQSILPFPANEAKTIIFSATGGNQIVANIINIYDNSDNSLVFTNEIQSFLLQNTIPANTLLNGSVYKAEIITKDISDNLSTESDAVVFYVLSDPIFTITNIDAENKVYSQNVTFSCTYSQAESEILESYVYNLYDSNQALIQSYPNTFSSTSPLTQLVQNLENNVLYYIECTTVSVNGQLGTSGLIQFTAIFVAPALYSTLTTTNVPSTGSVEISAIVLQLIGEMDTGTAIYQNSTWIDLTQGGQVSFQDGFEIDSSDFILKLWAKNIPDDTVFLKLYTSTGRIELHMADNCCHAYVYLTGLTTITPHYISNAVTISSGDAFMIHLKSQYNLLDLYLTLV
jgi:hypothetical protein